MKRTKGLRDEGTKRGGDGGPEGRRGRKAHEIKNILTTECTEGHGKVEVMGVPLFGLCCGRVDKKCLTPGRRRPQAAKGAEKRKHFVREATLRDAKQGK